MNSASVNLEKRKFLTIMLTFQLIVNILALFDAFFVRQVVGFLYFAFVPGFILIRILKMDDLGILEIILFSVGLSLALLMFLGLCINELCFLLGILSPLRFMPLMISLNVFIILGTVLAYLRCSGISFWKENFNFHPSALSLIILPILSIVGSIYVNVYKNNIIFLLMIALIAMWFIIGVFSNKLLPPKLYSFAIFLMAISLLFHSTLISNYIFSYGSDSPVEFFVFRYTQSNAYWSSLNPFPDDIQYGRFYSMLSITILPTLFSVILNVNPTWVFKVLFPLIFSFLPVGLYQLWRNYVGDKYAFIATFFFMSYETFFIEMIGLNRQMIGEIFFVLLLLVILNEKIKKSSKLICFLIFSFGLVTSHYGLSEIFLLLIFLTFICLFLIRKPSKNITTSMVLLFFTIMFSWYIFTTSMAVFDSILEFGNYVYKQMGDFFSPSVREPEIYRGLGLETPPTIWNAISRVFAYITEFLIVLGFVGILLNRKNSRIKKEYFILTFAAMVVLAALIIVPGLAGTMNTTRFYHILLFLLAPLCVLGGDFLFKLLKKHKEFMVSVFLLFVLVPYFLFQTGFVFEIAGSRSHSVPLSGYRMSVVRLCISYGYLYEQDVHGAQWLSENVNHEFLRVYSSEGSSSLISYGMIYRGQINWLSNVTEVASGEIVFLNRVNVVEGSVIHGFIWNTSDLSYIFDDLSLIYSNGDCQVYRKTG